jgi:eukaryotic-like serine/threonine-protein kinase
MALASSTRLGPYEILNAIGAGGMGEVYRARDTRLDRDVAVKVLPTAFSADAERLARFEREARAIAGLNHPHICTLHDIGCERPVLGGSATGPAAVSSERDEPIHFLVMEHLAGDTLDARLAKGPLKLEQALGVAAEIADALAAAHRQGIIHRDLKPANIMLTKSGVKLLDFGLARLTGHGDRPAAAEIASLATGFEAVPAGAGAQPVTGQGTILGTMPYMAPEQLEARPADARTDVWALGVVLYEMVTGTRAFKGDSAVSLMANIINAEPPALAAVRPLTPPALDLLVRQCLAKSPDDRWESARDVANQLRSISLGSGTAAAAVVRPRGKAWLQVVGIVGVFVVGAALASIWWLTRGVPAPAAPARIRAVIPLSAGQGLVGNIRSPLALSPDGRTLAFAAAGDDGRSQIFVRPLDRFEATPVLGTQGATGPFFSVDGEWIGFFVAAEGRLKKVALSGGAPVVLCEASDVRGASWGSDGTIVFTPEFSSGGLSRIPAAGGTPEVLTRPARDRGERTHRLPHLLPNGRGVIFTIVTQDIASFSDAIIAAYDFETRATTVLIRGGSDGRYVPPGYLAYGRGGALMVARFDAERLVVSGTPVSLMDGLLTSSRFGPADFSATATGTLAYVEGAEERESSRLILVDRTGRAVPVGLGERRHFVSAELSPTGNRAVVRLSGANDTLWIQNLTGSGGLSRLTFRGNVTGAVWTPDGRRIIYNVGTEMASIAADGSGDDRVVHRDEFTCVPTTITPDGKTVLYSTGRPGTGSDIWALSLDDGNVRPALNAKFNESSARLSEDGRWLAYVSDESGRREVYVRPFPALGGRFLISRDGGVSPIWSADGREIYFVNGADVYVVAVSATGGGFESGIPRNVPMPRSAVFSGITRDGRLLLIQGTPLSPLTSINVITAWLDELTRRLPLK